MLNHKPSSTANTIASGIALGTGLAYLLYRRNQRSRKDLKPATRSVGTIMTHHPVVCTPDTSLEEATQRMMEYDCGAIPVVENEASRRVVGVLTDRDIVARSVARGVNPLELRVADCMTEGTITVSDKASIEQACHLMQAYQIRRLPVVNSSGQCVGIVSQADIALQVIPQCTAKLLREVSKRELSAVSEAA